MSFPPHHHHQPSSSSPSAHNPPPAASKPPPAYAYPGGGRYPAPSSSSSSYSYDAGDRTPYGHLSPGASSVDSPAPPTPPAFLAPPVYGHQQPQHYLAHGTGSMSNVNPAGGGGYGGHQHYGYSQSPQQAPYGHGGQPGPSSAYAPGSSAGAPHASNPAIRDPYGDAYQSGPQDNLWAPPGFTPQDLVVHGPSVPFGFKAPLPLPLPAPFSPNQSRQILQPYHATPTSPAPPVYPIYEGPPIIAEVDMPSEEDWEVWQTTDAKAGIIDSLMDAGDIPARPMPICKRCHDYKVECSWPGQEGHGSCSNCFFAYSPCEVIPQSDSTPTQKPAELSSPAHMTPLPPASSSSSAHAHGSSPPGPSRHPSDHLLPRQRLVQNLQQQHPGIQSFGQAAADMAHPPPPEPFFPPAEAGQSDPRKIAGLPASHMSPAPAGAGSSPLDPNPNPSPLQQSRSSSPPRRQSEIDTEMEKLRSRVGELQMNAQLGLGRVQDELNNKTAAAAAGRNGGSPHTASDSGSGQRDGSVDSSGGTVSA